MRNGSRGASEIAAHLAENPFGEGRDQRAVAHLLAAHDVVGVLGRHAALEEPHQPAKHAYYIVCRKEMCDSPLVTAFTEWIAGKVRSDA